MAGSVLEMYKKEGLPNLRDASSVYCFGFAGLDHGWFRLEMHKNERGRPS